MPYNQTDVEKREQKICEEYMGFMRELIVIWQRVYSPEKVTNHVEHLQNSIQLTWQARIADSYRTRANMQARLIATQSKVLQQLHRRKHKAPLPPIQDKNTPIEEIQSMWDDVLHEIEHQDD